MPNETLIRPPDAREQAPLEEIEEIGEIALEAIPVLIDADPAGVIHKEFPSVSPRPGERIEYRQQEDILKAESVEQAPKIEAHSIADFEQLLGQPLPEEISRALATLKSEKLASVQSELDMLEGLNAQLKSELCSRWIVNGELQTPSLTERVAPQVIEIIEQKLQEYQKTENGQKDLKGGQLKQLVENPAPSDEDISKAAALLGIPSVKLGFMKSQKAKFASSVIASAKEFLEGDTEFDDLVDYRKRTPEEERASERYEIEDEISKIIDPARRSFVEQLNQSGLFDIRRRRDQKLPDLPSKIAELDRARTESAAQLLETARESQLQYLLSAVTKGHISIEDVTAILAEKEGPKITQNLQELARNFQAQENDRLWSLLPEPSLLGLDISEADIVQIGQGFDKLSETLTLMGLKTPDKNQNMEILQKEVAKTQEQFFEAIGSEYDMYWHFSPFGLRIIESKQLSPSQVTGNVMTGTHSRSLHFIKPGMTGMKSMVDYTQYAESGLTHGKSERIEDAFGIAVIYGLGDLARELPYRDEPPDTDRTSPDVVFRESEDKPERSMPLESAYILPMQTMEHINRLRENPEYSDIFTKEWQSREELAVKLTKRALELAGFDKAWIEEHVLPPVKYEEGRAPTSDVIYSKVSAQVRAQLPESRTLIVPISAEEGGFESHDSGSGQSTWHEKLIRLELAQQPN